MGTSLEPAYFTYFKGAESKKKPEPKPNVEFSTF